MLWPTIVILCIVCILGYTYFTNHLDSKWKPHVTFICNSTGVSQTEVSAVLQQTELASSRFETLVSEASVKVSQQGIQSDRYVLGGQLVAEPHNYYGKGKSGKNTREYYSYRVEPEEFIVSKDCVAGSKQKCKQRIYRSAIESYQDALDWCAKKQYPKIMASQLLNLAGATVDQPLHTFHRPTHLEIMIRPYRPLKNVESQLLAIDWRLNSWLHRNRSYHLSGIALWTENQVAGFTIYVRLA
jgi:hypothetical protein